MDPADLYRELAAALRRAEERALAAERDLADLRARLDQLITVLVGAGLLSEAQRGLFEQVGSGAAGKVRPRVKLRTYVNKYAMQGADIDCAARLHLCQARCCSFSFELTRQDLDEGRILWEVSEPYLIRHEADRYCSHLDRATGGCREHACRPAACRGYDCREDPRVWIDFEARIPAPMPDGLRGFR